MAGTSLATGLKELHQSLHPLEVSAELLARARRRFSRSPPSVPSTPSAGSTVLDDPDEKMEDPIEPAYQVDRINTRPRMSLRVQQKEELKVMQELWAGRKGMQNSVRTILCSWIKLFNLKADVYPTQTSVRSCEP